MVPRNVIGWPNPTTRPSQTLVTVPMPPAVTSPWAAVAPRLPPATRSLADDASASTAPMVPACRWMYFRSSATAPIRAALMRPVMPSGMGSCSKSPDAWA